MDVRYLVLALFFLVSCMPEGTVSKGNLAGQETSGGATGGADGDNTPSDLTWNYLGQLTNSITINVSNLNNAYITGTPVENYLNMSGNISADNYCLISQFSISGITHELRTRVVPISYYDFTLRRTVKVLRADFQDTENAATFCGKNLTARIIDSSGGHVVDPSTPSVSYRFNAPGDLCSTCTSIMPALRTKLFKKEISTNTLDEVQTVYINTSRLSLQIDPNNSTGGNGGMCSNSICKGKGFDCCLDNQCVKDGARKPAAEIQYPSLLAMAEEEKKTNPLAYRKYPQLYYVCGSSVPSTTGGSNGGSTGGGYDAAFEQLKKDYMCIEHLKANTPSTPFHSEIATRSYPEADNCLTDLSQKNEPFYYKNVLKRLYQTCGCNRTDIDQMIENCPNYEYEVIETDSSGNPTRIDCYTPPTQNLPIPSTQSVTVSSRTAPHRFFDKNGIERSPSDGIQQEGDVFTYLDESKVLPVQENFGMNSILGQMSVSLDKALPAKAVNVELDQVYLISTTSGYYTPCPTCGKDSWLTSLSAFPTSASGVGLQAVGHTTERDALSTNTLGANYEDTIFGRACWVPPTMLPFSHSPKIDAHTQRIRRLETQAALYSNGYQRDWFGFNKGALIGSFDGVTWFAIGKGRIVRSSSTKLHLAINAPFADVAASTLHVVSVQAYDGITQAAQVDYDPEYHQYHSYQNEAGNCQKYHMCNTDKDCITSLGWEYACADVRDVTTNWPEFDHNGNELAPSSVKRSLDQILQQKRFPTASSKRCVYRGAGAVCHTNSESISSADLNRRKILTCAPNFYCASTGANAHNTKVARYANKLENIPQGNNHTFGKDANVLGRPHDYLANQSLTGEIPSTLAANLATYEPSMLYNTGLCQPGKALPQTAGSTLANPYNQHKSQDYLRRADFISQIGSCNSALFSADRHTSCPVLNADGNYEMFASATLTSYAQKATSQNACGLETLLPSAPINSNNSDSLQSYSPFSSIEAKPLNSQIILNPTLVRDACYRRAGAVCHTDLDCSPNKMHAEQAEFFGTDFFGNIAEKSYWTEYLVCGQADPKPLPTSPTAFRNYDMSKNLCCREVGKSLTTYTGHIPTSTNNGNYVEETKSLKMSVAAGTNPSDPLRYSRLGTVNGIGTVVNRPVLSAYQDRNPSTGFLLKDPDYTSPVYPDGISVWTPHQWKTLNEANSESCCGGGWIRKFSDGSTDWTRRDRLFLDVTNFQCINSRTPLLTHPEDVSNQYGLTSSATPAAKIVDVQSLINQDYSEYCRDATNTSSACAQYSISNIRYDVRPTTTATYTSVTINTLSPSYDAILNGDNYFMPRSADGDPNVIIDFGNATGRRNIVIKLPSFVTREFDHAYNDLLNGTNFTAPFNIRMRMETGAPLNCIKDSTYNPVTSVAHAGGASGAPASCVFSYNSTTRILKVGPSFSTFAPGGVFEGQKVGIEFVTNTPGSNPSIHRTQPGSSAYYLSRLGKLELSGIPQIVYEELTCNDNSNRLVGGIFRPEKKYSNSGNVTDSFRSTGFAFRKDYFSQDSSGNPVGPIAGHFTNANGLQHGPVFSANDFKCCSPLGKQVDNASKCCSGYVVDNGSKFCALPDGTNLMVYFNRFVSNEGRGTEQPGGGLEDTDFDDRTGEPLLTSTVNSKIRSLGLTYCASGRVRQGGAFGMFPLQPKGPNTNASERIFNIVDSPSDIGQESNAGATYDTGYIAFTNGFRWNHHLYCDDR